MYIQDVQYDASHFFFKIVLVILFLLPLHMHFGVIWSVSTKVSHYDFNGKYVRPAYQLGKKGPCPKLNLSVHEHGMSLLFIRSLRYLCSVYISKQTCLIRALLRFYLCVLAGANTMELLF